MPSYIIIHHDTVIIIHTLIHPVYIRTSITWTIHYGNWGKYITSHKHIYINWKPKYFSFLNTYKNNSALTSAISLTRLLYLGSDIRCFIRVFCTIGMNILYFFPSCVTSEQSVAIACLHRGGGSIVSRESSSRIIGWIILEAKSERSRWSVSLSTVFRASLKVRQRIQLPKWHRTPVTKISTANWYSHLQAAMGKVKQLRAEIKPSMSKYYELTI